MTSGGEWGDDHLVAEGFEVADGSCAGALRVALGVEVGAEFFVGFTVSEHVPDGDEDAVLERYERAELTSAKDQPPVAGGEERALRTRYRQVTSSAAPSAVMLAVVGLWAGAMLLGRACGPVVRASFLTHVLASSEMPRLDGFGGPVLRAGFIASTLSTIVAVVIGGSVVATGLCEPSAATAFVFAGICVGADRAPGHHCAVGQLASPPKERSVSIPSTPTRASSTSSALVAMSHTAVQYFSSVL